jgi:hypothetical protein
MKYGGYNWVNVGNAGFSAGRVEYTNLAFSSTGVPYVAYQDLANGSKATVMKYDSIYYGINEHHESRISIYPNPAEAKCEVRSAKCDIKNIQLINLMGERVYSRDYPAGTGNSVEVGLDLPAGVYFVRVTGANVVEVGKVVKN